MVSRDVKYIDPPMNDFSRTGDDFQALHEKRVTNKLIAFSLEKLKIYILCK